MQPATMTNRTLEIDGMTGDACVQKVTGALKGVQGVETRFVKVGMAKVGADQAGCDAACAAIQSAGFKAHERARSGETNDPARATQTPPASPKTGGQPGSPNRNPAATTAGHPAAGGEAKATEGACTKPDLKLAGSAN